MKLSKFSDIVAMAESHHGGSRGIKAKLKDDEFDAAALDRGDDRFLSGMTHAIFSSGFSWTRNPASAIGSPSRRTASRR